MATDNFKHLVLTNYPTMFRVAYSILRDSDDAQDAVQDAVTALWNSRARLAEIDNYEAFCVTAVKRKCIDIARARQSRPSTLDEEVPDREDEADLTKAVEARDTLTLVMELVDKLPPLQRDVLRLRAEAGCDLREIAELKGISQDNARTLLSRARKKLKDLYTNLR